VATLSISYSTATVNEFTASAILSDTSLATGRIGDTFSNATTFYVDVLFSGVLKLATGITINTQVEVWMAAAKGGLASQLTANAPTTEGAFTPGPEKPLMQLVTVYTVTATATANERQINIGPYSVAALYGGSLPQYFAPFVVHNTGVALAASTATSHYWEYQGVNYTSA